MINKFRKKQALVLSGILLIASLCVYVFSVSKNQEVPSIETKPIASYMDKFSGFSPDTKMTTNYLMGNNKIAKDIYAVQYVLTSNNSDYIDIELQINKRSHKISAALSGLSNKAKISLMVGQNPYHTNIPVDWAGRSVLSADNVDFLNENDVCFEINGLYQNQRSTLCHNTANTAERQGRS